MCTVIPSYKKKKPELALIDIPVYKVGDKMTSGCFVSPFHHAVYMPNMLYKAEMTFQDNISCCDHVESMYLNGLKNPAFVKTGFHAFTSLDRTKKFMADSDYDDSSNVALFIIPEGSLYYSNPAGNIVSNQIIFKEFIDANK